MKATVSEKGQVTIPKKLREALGLRAGDVLEFHEEEGRLVAVKRTPMDAIDAAVGSLAALDAFPEWDVDTFIDEIRGGPPDAVDPLP